MKILITGAKGKLGRELEELLSPEYDIYGCDIQDDRRPKFFTAHIEDRNRFIKEIERIKPNVVIHAAAATDVEKCESDRNHAMKVNFHGTKNVVDGCRHVKGSLIYISTDFVFSGNRKEPYQEGAIPHPLSVYGESKLLGEFYVREQSLQYMILRTAWLFGKYGEDFMSKILARTRQSKELRVVNDQTGSPTYATHLALAIRAVIRKIASESSEHIFNSIYHTVNRGKATRYDVANELVKQAHMHDIKVTPIDSSEFHSIVKRPVYSVLDNSRFEKTFDYQFPTWQEAVGEYLTATGTTSYADRK